jgi:phosphoribosylanthranilate isomerase
VIIQVGYFTGAEEARRAAALGVDQIGFVAGRYGQVYGELGFNEVREITDAMPPGTTTVAMSLSTHLEEILHMLEAVQPDVLHIASNVEEVNEEVLVEIRRQAPQVRLMKAIPVMDSGAVAVAKRFAPVSNMLLLESKCRGFSGVGGTGQVHNWTLSRQIVEAVDVPVMLGGGLTAENVVDAIRAVRPWGVVSNTGTDQAGRHGVKDLARVEAFINAVRKEMTHPFEENGT